VSPDRSRRAILVAEEARLEELVAYDELRAAKGGNEADQLVDVFE
jgi:hypothetical protein